MTDQSDRTTVAPGSGQGPVADPGAEPSPGFSAFTPATPPLPAQPTGRLDPQSDPSDELIELAGAYGVATEFWDWRGQPVNVLTRTITGVLAGLDVLVETEDDVSRELTRARLRPWRQLLPDVIVTREGQPGTVSVHVEQSQSDGERAPKVWLVPEDGGPAQELALTGSTVDGTTGDDASDGTTSDGTTSDGTTSDGSTSDGDAVDGDVGDGENDKKTATSARATRTARTTPAAGTAEVDGLTIVRLVYALPEDIPLGWHSLRAVHGGNEQVRPFVVTPSRMQLPAGLEHERAWGFMTQLYSVRSSRSWGLGDLGDLNELASWSGRELGAGFVLINPLHAAEPVAPMEPSPYLPMTRRFFNPIYLRVEDIREVAYLPATERAILEWQAEAMQALNTDPGELDRDAVWAAKLSVLDTVFAFPRSRGRQDAFESFCQREGQGLTDFATWCALAEHYGIRTDGWPAHALDARGDAVESMRREHATRVRFYQWLQWCMDEQLAEVARTAADAGMPVGIVHDLAVGVHPDGADAWALGSVLARGVSGGAPPDAFNQQGQNWSQAPWRPDRLAESGYASFRDMLRTVLRHAGALRVDHIIGLFRMWWVPEGFSPADGTYVRYDHEALLGILALEAHRAGSFVVGEDLGTVEPWARDYLRERGLLGTSILWFEKDGDGTPLPPQAWRELCLATVTTHDLPPTAGYLAGEHIELRDRLGLLTRPLADEVAADQADQAAVLGQLTDLGLLGPGPTERDKIEALHRFLTRTPAKLIGVALADAVGDRRTMNQPGTQDEYPNWRLPLADGVGRPMMLEEVMDTIRATALARVVSETEPLA